MSSSQAQTVNEAFLLCVDRAQGLTGENLQAFAYIALKLRFFTLQHLERCCQARYPNRVNAIRKELRRLQVGKGTFLLSCVRGLVRRNVSRISCLRPGYIKLCGLFKLYTPAELRQLTGTSLRGMILHHSLCLISNYTVDDIRKFYRSCKTYNTPLVKNALKKYPDLYPLRMLYGQDMEFKDPDHWPVHPADVEAMSRADTPPPPPRYIE